jgi:ankyrin repeat protein
MNEEEFFNAFRISDLEKVNEFLEKGADINKQDKDGFTPLMIVCMNYQKMADTILKANTNSNVNYKEGYNTYNTIITNNKLIADILLEKGANVNIQNKKGLTCLMICSTKNYFSFVESLTNKPFNKQYLMSNIYYNNLDILKNIIKAGADVNMKDKIGNMALHYASQTNNVDIALELINAKSDINFKNVFLSSPLLFSILTKSEDVFNILIKMNVDVQGTPLYNAIKMKNMNMIKALIKKGADINTISYGYTPLSLAVLNNDEELIKLLLDNGANINKASTDLTYTGYTPLMFAVDKEYVDIVQLLIDRGADANKKSAHDSSAYVIAYHKNNKEIIKILNEYSKKIINKRIGELNIKKPNYFYKKNDKFNELQEKAISIWQEREKNGKGGPICDLEGFNQHYGECGNDAFQMLLVSSDKIKHTVQNELIHTNYDEVNFNTFMTVENIESISAPILLKSYIQGLQSRFIRHYLNDDILCSLGEKKAKYKLYRAKGANSIKSQISLHYGIYNEVPESLEKYTEKHGGINFKLIFRVFTSIFKIFNINITPLVVQTPDIIKDMDIDSIDSILFGIDNYRYSHALCFYECGKKQFLFEDNYGPIRFEWKLFLNIYKKLLIAGKRVYILFKEFIGYEYPYYPVIHIHDESKQVYIHPYTYKVLKNDSVYSYSNYKLNDFTPITFTSGVTENKNIKEINEPQRTRLSTIPAVPRGTPLPKMNDPNIQRILPTIVKGGKRKTKKVRSKNRKTIKRYLSKRVK